MGELVSSNPPDISKPRWDQASFQGRARHFFSIANPMNLLVTDKTLEKSRQTVQDYRSGIYRSDLTVEELWRAKTLYDSAFHPDSGEKMLAFGRMSAQVPCNMMIVGGMLTFHKKFSHVIFFHWLNQSFNAIVNYTNRSGSNESSNQRLATCYAAATGGSIGIALGANQIVKSLSPALGRFVPFLAVAGANAINIPMMRSNEFTEGIAVFDRAGTQLGVSREVPKTAVLQVLISRIAMAVPNMVAGPIVYSALTKRRWFKKWMSAPLQIVICGIMLAVSTPVGCAFFEQKGSVKVGSLEKSLQEELGKLPNPPKIVYFNKGL